MDGSQDAQPPRHVDNRTGARFSKDALDLVAHTVGADRANAGKTILNKDCRSIFQSNVQTAGVADGPQHPGSVVLEAPIMEDANEPTL